MTTIINHGIISNNGNNNINILSTTNTNLSYSTIKNELNILEKHTDENLNDLKTACEEENPSLLLRGLKALKKETIDLIKLLGLQTLKSLLERFF